MAWRSSYIRCLSIGGPSATECTAGDSVRTQCDRIRCPRIGDSPILRSVPRSGPCAPSQSHSGALHPCGDPFVSRTVERRTVTPVPNVPRPTNSQDPPHTGTSVVGLTADIRRNESEPSSRRAVVSDDDGELGDNEGNG
jgi:hypothetical protein